MCVITIAFVRGVETEQTQVASEPTQMCIRKEPWFAQRLRSHARNRSDVERLEHRVDCNAIAIAYTIREIDGFAVDYHQIHFGMWNARRFDRILHRDLSIEEALDGHETVPSRQEVV